MSKYCECGNLKERPGIGCDRCRTLASTWTRGGDTVKHVPQPSGGPTTLKIASVENHIHAEWMWHKGKVSNPNNEWNENQREFEDWTDLWD